MKNPNRFYFKNGVILPLTDEKPADYLLTSTDEFSVLKDVFPGSIARVNGKEYQLDPNGNWEEKAGSSPEEIKNRIRFYIKDGHICPLGDDLPSEYYVATMDELAQLAPMVFPGSIAYVNGQKYELDPHGDWDRKAEGGGGGATTMEDLLDVVVNEPTEGQVLVYDDYNDKWKNQDAPTGLPDVTTADEGKLLTVDSEGEWAAIELQVAPGEVVIDDTLLVTGAAADAKAAGDRIRNLEETKANIDGYYERMTVGNAEQLVATVGVEDEAPYNFRTAGGSADIGDRLVDKIVGGTVAWNQLLKFGDGDSWSATPSYVDLTKDVNTKTLSLTFEERSYRIKTSQATKQGHVYLASANIIATTDCAVAIEFSRGWARIIETVQANTEKYVASVTTLNTATDQYAMLQYYIYGTPIVTYPQTMTIRNPQLFDLTQMFGSTIADYIYSLETANAGAGVAWFRKLFPKPYYTYNAGELMSVQAASHVTRGFNAWDEEWVNDNQDISTTTGELISGGIVYYFRSKNFIPILPSTVYYDWNQAIGGNYRIFYYDAAKNYISYISHPTRTTFTTPANAYYMKFRFPSSNGYTYQNNICINLSWDSERDGEYEPYTLHEYPLDSSITLRGIPKLDANNELYYDGDEYEADGTVKRRYGIVDLGTLTFTKHNDYVGTFYVDLADAVPASGSSKVANILCSAYESVSRNAQTNQQSVDSSVSLNKTNGNISRVFVLDTSKNDMSATAFATAVSGIYLVYELSTPTTETAEPYQNPQIVDDFGTEEYVDAAESAETPTRDVAIPVGHVTTYQANLRAKLEMAPNSPDGDGDYIVRQTNGQNEYVALTFPADELPAAPTDNGTYTLKCTVSGSGTTYAWVADT